MLFGYGAPIISGTGKRLPILLGLKSLSEKKAIFEMEQGKEYLTFPGPGGYEVKVSPGSARIPLQRAMSGHVMAPFAAYDKLKSAGAMEEKQVLHANAQSQRESQSSELVVPELAASTAANSASED